MIRTSRDNETDALVKMGIGPEGLDHPHYINGWYPWTNGKEHGYTTLLSCAGAYMGQGCWDNIEMRLQSIYRNPSRSEFDKMKVELWPEPENIHDPDAIQVVFRYNSEDVYTMIGYIPGKAGSYLNRAILGMLTDGNIHTAIVGASRSCNAPGGKVAHHNIVLRIWQDLLVELEEPERDIDELNREILLSTLMIGGSE